jgi:DNA-binding FadR family transcriptional regulator
MRQGGETTGPGRRRHAIRLAREIGRWLDEAGGAENRLPHDIPALCRRFGATRASVLAALGLLEEQGRLTLVPGPGSGQPEDRASDPAGRLAVEFQLAGLTVGDIFELRALLEPELAAGLAGRLPDAVLDELGACLGPMPSDPPHLIAIGFHQRLAREADNMLLAVLIELLADLLRGLPDTRQDAAVTDDAFRRQTHQYHLRMLSALRDGRAADARRAMLDHLESTQHYLDARDRGLLARFVAE